MKAASRERSLDACSLLAIAVVVAFVFWPGLHAFWGRDDYMQLAFVRLLDSPWPLFTHDHFFPAPGSIFRPLGFASMWLCERLFGGDYAMNAGFDLALHIAVAFALFGVLRAVAAPHMLATFATLAFAVHPVAIGTALWWSARFDLLATLFVLLGLRAAIVYRASPRAGVPAAMALALLAALLSKEIGLVAALPVSWIFLRWAWSEHSQRWRALGAFALTWACGALYFAWRWAVIGTPLSGITGASMTMSLGSGVIDWLQQMPGYIGFGARLDRMHGVPLLFACSLLAIAATASLFARRDQRMRSSSDAFIAGLLLLVVPAIVQAPITVLNGAPLSASMSTVSAAMQARLYYLGCAGVALMIATIVARGWRIAWLRRVSVAALVVVVVAFASVSRQSAQAFAARSNEIAAPARAAVAAIDRIALPPGPCHVTLLGVEPAPEWGEYVSMDSIVKALAPDLARVGGCFFHSDHTTWFYLLRGDVSDADAAPYTPLAVAGRRVPWLRFGGETIAYLVAPTSVAADTLQDWRVLVYRNGRFDDVSAAAAAGHVPVALK